jgi:hypothetical protein
MAASATAGTFTCAELVDVQIAMDRIWESQTLNANDYKAEVESVIALKAKQTAQLRELEDPAKDKTINVYWVTDCNTSIAACSDDCSVGGPELEARCKEYALDLCQTAGFTVREKSFRALSVTREETIAKGMLKRMKELDEYLAQTLIAKLNTFAGVNQYEGIGDVENSGVTYIAPSYWTADLTAYFALVAKMNKLGTVTLLHGTNLWNSNWTAMFNSLNANQKDQMAKMASVQQVWDPFNVDTVNAGSKVSYMISNGAIAIATKAYYPTTPTTYMDNIRYSVPSKNLPGVFYDVVYKNRCLSNETYHDFSLYIKAGIFSNPYGCDEDVTGVLKFICGTNAGS